MGANYAANAVDAVGGVYRDGYALLETSRSEADTQLSAGKATLDDSEKMLKDGLQVLTDSEKLLQDAEIMLAEGALGVQAGERELDAGKAALAEGATAYYNGKAASEKALAEGSAALWAGEDALAEGKRELAGAKSMSDTVVPILNGVVESAPVIGAAMGDPSANFTQFETWFPGCDTWASYIDLAGAYAAAGGGDTGTVVEETRQSLVNAGFEAKKSEIDSLVCTTLQGLAENEAAIKAEQIYGNDENKTSSEGGFGDLNKAAFTAACIDAYKASNRDTVKGQVEAEEKGKIEAEINEQLLSLGNGVLAGADGAFDAILGGVAGFPDLILALEQLFPDYAEAIAPLKSVFAMPEGSVAEKLAKCDAVSAALNDDSFAETVSFVTGTVDRLISDGEALIASSEAELSAGWAQYNSLRALAAESLAAGWKSLEEGRVGVALGEAALNEGRAAYQAGLEGYLAGKAEYEAGLEGYETGLVAFEDGKATYENARSEAEQALLTGQTELDNAEAMLSGIGVRIEKTPGEQGTEVALEHSIGSLQWIALLILALASFFITFAATGRMVKKNSEAIRAMRREGVRTSSITAQMARRFIPVAAVASVVGAAIGGFALPIAVNSVAGGALSDISISVSIGMAVACIAVAALASALGLLLAGRSVKKAAGRV
jgi:putative ABC transport system permease protein